MIKLALFALIAIGIAVWALIQVPWRDPGMRRKARFLALLPLPPVLLAVFGPVGVLRAPYGLQFDTVLQDAQKIGPWVSLVLALGLLAWLKGARLSALILGVMAVLATVVVAGVNEIILTPGS